MASKKTAAVANECVACGNCVKYCPISAIQIHKGRIAKIDTDVCVGCGKCAKACPASVISILLKVGSVNEEKAMV